MWQERGEDRNHNFRWIQTGEHGKILIDFSQIQEIDINPLLVFDQGKGCKVVDARIVIS